MRVHQDDRKRPPYRGRLLLFRHATAGHDRAAVGTRDLRAAHAVRVLRARWLSGRLDDRARLQRFRRPAGARQRRGGPEFDLPLRLLALVVSGLEVEERMWVLEQELRDRALRFHVLRGVVERRCRMVRDGGHSLQGHQHRSPPPMPPRSSVECSWSSSFSGSTGGFVGERSVLVLLRHHPHGRARGFRVAVPR